MRRSWTFPVTLIGALFLVSLALTGLNLTHHLPQRQWLTALWQPDRNDIDQMVFHFSLLPRLAIALLAGAGLGLVGVLILLALYLLLIMRGLVIAARAQTTFGRVMAGGLMLILFVYVFVNIGMVSGILPVVGVPLPLVSYGGSALIVLMAGFGIVMSIHTHRKLLSKSV